MASKGHERLQLEDHRLFLVEFSFTTIKVALRVGACARVGYVRAKQENETLNGNMLCMRDVCHYNELSQPQLQFDS